MSTERNKQVVRRLYDVVNSGDIETLNELAVLDYDEHDPLPGQATGRQGLADRVTILRTAFAPQFTIEDVIAEHAKRPRGPQESLRTWSPALARSARGGRPLGSVLDGRAQ